MKEKAFGFYHFQVSISNTNLTPTAIFKPPLEEGLAMVSWSLTIRARKSCLLPTLTTCFD